MKKSLILTIVAVVLVGGLGIFFFTKKSGNKTPGITENTEIDLPINTIPVTERPFLTLTPDSTGHSLDISVAGAPQKGSMEYELIYNASGKQEGALGTIQLSSATQPIVKEILLGSRSAGGATTYHEGVTGGSLTVTYDETRLKESWNYLHFDPADPTISSTDARFTVGLSKTALKKDQIIVTMKTFGVAGQTGLPENAKIIAGPYGYFAQTAVKGSAQISLKLPAGEHVNPTIYEWDGKVWKKATTKLAGETVSTTASSSVFIVTAE